MLAKLRDLTLNRDGSQNLTVTVSGDLREMFDQLHEADVDIEIKKHRKRRSLDANAFCWALCTDIGNAMTPPIPKEEVYRAAIRDVGVYYPLPIKDDRVADFRAIWSQNGTGWFVDVTDKSKTPGYTLCFAYYGTSTYDTAQMSRLIDYLKQDMEVMGLPIPIGKTEQERLLQEWGDK
jgi:hypothetical protein